MIKKLRMKMIVASMVSLFVVLLVIETHVNASGDGIDSNGFIYIAGGETYISGPTTGGNGNIDYGIEAVLTGGIFVAAGIGYGTEF